MFTRIGLRTIRPFVVSPWKVRTSLKRSLVVGVCATAFSAAVVAADKVYTINPRVKTYSVVSFKEAIENGAGLPDAVANRSELTANVSLDQAKTDPDIKSIVAGMGAEKLSFFGSVSAMAKTGRSTGFSDRGGLPAGGGFPGEGGRRHGRGNGNRGGG